jgi:hypothetical protein
MTPGSVDPTADRDRPNAFAETPGEGREMGASVAGRERDARIALSYLLYGDVDDYVALMDILESSVAELTPTEIARAAAEAGRVISLDVVEVRLESLRGWSAAHATTDASRIRRHADLLARNWRYSATAVGRQVHRFYRTYLAGTPTVREIPLAGLNRIVRCLQALRDGPAEGVADNVGTLFATHDDLDAALVGAEDALAGLADRYDLDGTATAELRGLLVDYATRVAAELEDGAVLAAHHLAVLWPRVGELAATAVAASDARALIERGALVASRGGRVEDWEGLAAWFDPDTGRAARFSMRLVRALPGMHANLRRLHSSAGAATSRSRALRLAAACTHADNAAAILNAALGDHPWRKLAGDESPEDLPRVPSWAAGPSAPTPHLLALTGRGGARGRIPAARDDTEARAAVDAARQARAAAHGAAVAEVLAAPAGAALSEGAAQVALASLLAAARRGAWKGARTANNHGLACTLFHLSGTPPVPAVAADTWKVWTPGRVAVFHHPDRRPAAPSGMMADDALVAAVAVESAR